MDYLPLIDSWQGGELHRWAQLLPQQLNEGLSEKRYGDLPRWRKVLGNLPSLQGDDIQLNRDRVSVSSCDPIDAATRSNLREQLMGLHPWRKGPFELFGIHIDTEWRSDWKWQRLLPHLAPLKGRRVLDVGCGNGYHCWRMRGEGAGEVIGIDPSPLFVVQFWAIQSYLQQTGIWVIPTAMEQLPPALNAFDTVFSMGVLYHRRSPLDHLLELRGSLKPGGQLVLETLVIDGGPGATLVPPGRYARMGNVWFLPSCDTLLGWLEKTGFRSSRVVDVNQTRLEEQRSTEWMQFHSLKDFLDPADQNRTLEGHPAPRRAIVIAELV